MSMLQVESLLFTFAPTVVAEPYDTWDHYRRVWNNNNPAGGQKGMDVVAIENAAVSTNWLIEAKDFRIVDPNTPPNPCNVSGLHQTVADKSEHTLAGLADAAHHAKVVSEKNHAENALATNTQRIVLHLEEHTGPHSKLFPSGFSANVLIKLKPLVKHIDPNPLVLNIRKTPSAGVPWTVV